MSSSNPTTGDDPNQTLIPQTNPLADAPTAQRTTEDAAFAPGGPSGAPQGQPDPSRLGGGTGQQAWASSASGNIPARSGGDHGAMPMPAGGPGAETGGPLRGREDQAQSGRAAPGQDFDRNDLDTQGTHAGGTMDPSDIAPKDRIADRLAPSTDPKSQASVAKTGATMGTTGGAPTGPTGVAQPFVLGTAGIVANKKLEDAVSRRCPSLY
jgi:hypothetical protein